MNFVELYRTCKILKHSDFYPKNPLGISVEYTYRHYIPSHPDILTFLCNENKVVYYDLKKGEITDVKT